VIEQVNAFGEECLKKYGTRLFYCADELYLRAELPLPDEDYYEGYPQIENGVGMLTSLGAEFEYELENLSEWPTLYRPPRRISVVTGAAAYPRIAQLCQKLEAAVEGLEITVYRIVNHFFGESVTVAGLLTAGDVIDQLKGKTLGEELLFPAVMLRADGEVFLDDMTPDALSKALGGIPLRAVSNDGTELLKALLGIE